MQEYQRISGPCVHLTANRCHTCGMAGGTSLTRATVEYALRRAAEEGHDLEAELVRVKITKNGTGVAARCSCGWQSTPKTKRVKAFSAGFQHIGEVLGDVMFDAVAGGGGASPSGPERQVDATEERLPGGEGEPSSRTGGHAMVAETDLSGVTSDSLLGEPLPVRAHG